MNQVSIMPIGAGCQVGRSCIILKYQHAHIMLDCGLHMGKEKHSALPIFDKIQNTKSLDLILITHSHLDHCGALPYFLENMDFNGKIFMTHPTKQIYNYLLHDSLKVRSDQLFEQQQINRSMTRIETVNFEQAVQYKGIKIVPYCAGHVLGAAMFLITIGNASILYTGDYSCQQQRYIQPATLPDVKIDVLIVESTYGTKQHQPRHQRERNFTSKVEQIVKRGGKCLLPVFAVGRAQQILLLLEQYWNVFEQQLQDIKIYYTCALIKKCKDVYRKYISMLSKTIQEKFYKQESDPFYLRHVHWLKSLPKIDQEKENPLVIMCSPGMLQSGQSRQLLQKWCHDPKNGVILTGYCVQGSLAYNLRKGNKIIKMDGSDAQVKMDVSIISFSAHADCIQTTNFIKKCQPQYVVLIHGNQKNAKSLQKHLLKQFKGIISDIVAPQNTVEVRFKIQKKTRCKIVGSLVDKIKKQIQNQDEIKIKQEGNSQTDMPSFNIPVKGQLILQPYPILISQQQSHNFLKKQKIFNKLHIKYGGTLDLANFLCNHVFSKGKIQNGKLIIQDNFQLSVKVGQAILQWQSSEKKDIMADQFAFLLSQIINKDYDLFDQKHGGQPRCSLLLNLVKQEWPESQINKNMLQVVQNYVGVGRINLDSLQINCRNEIILKRLQGMVQIVNS